LYLADFVQKLIMKEQKTEAARFIRAYLIPTKIKPPISCIQENGLHWNRGCFFILCLLYFMNHSMFMHLRHVGYQLMC